MYGIPFPHFCKLFANRGNPRKKKKSSKITETLGLILTHPVARTMNLYPPLMARHDSPGARLVRGAEYGRFRVYIVVGGKVGGERFYNEIIFA